MLGDENPHKLCQLLLLTPGKALCLLEGGPELAGGRGNPFIAWLAQELLDGDTQSLRDGGQQLRPGQAPCAFPKTDVRGILSDETGQFPLGNASGLTQFAQMRDGLCHAEIIRGRFKNSLHMRSILRTPEQCN